MANFTASRVGAVNGGADKREIFLKVFAGEVLTAYRRKTAFGSRSMVRTIESGKSAQFPATWRAAAAYHTPGAELAGQSILSGERTISIDDVLIADVFIASIDQAMSHFEFRREYSYQLGEVLAQTYDKNVAQVMLLAARAAATVTGGNGGTALTAATALTNADTLIATIADAAQALDEKDVPESDRYIWLKPDQYYLLVNSGSKALHTDYNPEGNGSLKSGKIQSLFGMEIVKTNNLPQSNVTTGPTAYQGNFATVAALVAQRGAAGTVKLVDLAIEDEYSARHQGTLMLAKYAVGCAA